MNKQEIKIYWKGFEDGKQNSLNHNIILMKCQLKASKEIVTNSNKRIKKIIKQNKHIDKKLERAL